MRTVSIGKTAGVAMCAILIGCSGSGGGGGAGEDALSQARSADASTSDQAADRGLPGVDQQDGAAEADVTDAGSDRTAGFEVDSGRNRAGDASDDTTDASDDTMDATDAVNDQPGGESSDGPIDTQAPGCAT